MYIYFLLYLFSFSCPNEASFFFGKRKRNHTHTHTNMFRQVWQPNTTVAEVWIIKYLFVSRLSVYKHIPDVPTLRGFLFSFFSICHLFCFCKIFMHKIILVFGFMFITVLPLSGAPFLFRSLVLSGHKKSNEIRIVLGKGIKKLQTTTTIMEKLT